MEMRKIGIMAGELTDPHFFCRKVLMISRRNASVSNFIVNQSYNSLVYLAADNLQSQNGCQLVSIDNMSINEFKVTCSYGTKHFFQLWDDKFLSFVTE